MPMRKGASKVKVVTSAAITGFPFPKPETWKI